ncbi:YheU family protein [Shewanella intestini]|uniref:YheU family protein n=1 Tax=Shewanella intestini TaxID=2017544 RepID=A0ABS5I106_9GAMM|nr:MULTISPECIES: YheU family protein [Shewanella]MBR9727708.1 YheU family protein [Shewanella intestini]MRG35142.1 YheU family protein [Shewanella sp. XMDDZSB0408]
MIIPYDALMSLPASTLAQLIKEHLLSQLEDGSFADIDQQQFEQAIASCKYKLKQGELVVEYSEDDESIAIRHKEHIIAVR